MIEIIYTNPLKFNWVENTNQSILLNFCVYVWITFIYSVQFVLWKYHVCMKHIMISLSSYPFLSFISLNSSFSLEFPLLDSWLLSLFCNLFYLFISLFIIFWDYNCNSFPFSFLHPNTCIYLYITFPTPLQIHALFFH